MPWLIPSVIATATGTAILTLCYFYLYSLDGKNFLKLWAISWAVYFTRYGFLLVMLFWQKTSWLLIANQLASLLSGVLLLYGTYLFINKKFPRIFSYLSVLGGLWIFFSILNNYSFLAMSLPTFSLLAGIYVWTGIVFLQSSQTEGKEITIVGIGFILWGIHKANYPFLQPVVWFAPWGYLFAAAIEFIVALGLLLVYFRKARDEITASEEKFRSLAESSRDYIVRYDRHGRHTYMNPAALALSGLTEADTISKTPLECGFPEELCAMWEDKIMQVFATDEPYKMEYSLKSAAGPVYLDLQLTPEHDAKDRVFSVLGVSHDITERKQAEEALQASEAHLRTLINTIPDLVWLKNSEGVYLDCNSTFEQLFGVEAAAIVGKTDYDFVSKELAEFFREHDRNTIKAGKASVYEEHLAFAGTGYKGEFETIKTPMYSSDGKLLGVLGISHDITERKQAEYLLRQSEATVRNKLKTIIEPEGDIRELELANIIDTNALQPVMEEFFQLTGMLGSVNDISGKELIAVGWQDICAKFHRCHPDTLKNCVESDTSLTDGVHPGTFRAYRCKNNMWHMVTPLMVGGSHVGNVFIGQFFYAEETVDAELFREQAREYGFDETKYLAALDRIPRFTKEFAEAGIRFYAKLAGIISTMSFSALQQSALLAQLQQSEEKIRLLNVELEQRVYARTAQFEASNKELEAFAYSVSHDLRAPLRHIDGYVNLLVSGLRADLPDKERHYLDTISASARQMGLLIDNLLRFSRTGQSEMRLESTDMYKVLQEALTTLREDTEGRSIEWGINDLPSVQGDQTLLRQVWVNLLGNAVKYTKSREVARITVSASREKGEIIFAVADNGVGFDMKYVHKLFGVFQRLHSAEQFEGTGIGLATVQRIITRHGGRIWAEAELNVGATFYFSLPG